MKHTTLPKIVDIIDADFAGSRLENISQPLVVRLELLVWCVSVLGQDLFLQREILRDQVLKSETACGQ